MWTLTNQRPVSRSWDQSRPIRGRSDLTEAGTNNKSTRWSPGSDDVLDRGFSLSLTDLVTWHKACLSVQHSQSLSHIKKLYHHVLTKKLGEKLRQGDEAFSASLRVRRINTDSGDVLALASFLPNTSLNQPQWPGSGTGPLTPVTTPTSASDDDPLHQSTKEKWAPNN